MKVGGHGQRAGGGRTSQQDSKRKVHASPPAREGGSLANAILDRNQPPLVIADLAAQCAIFGEKVA
jgi:hypothetical protein